MRIICVFALLLATGSFAQMRNMAEDNSTSMKQAKKVAVFINLGTSLPGWYQPSYERAKKLVGEKLTKQKLELVAKASDADLVLVVVEYNVNAGTSASAQSVGGTTTVHAQDHNCLADDLKVYKGGKQPTPDDSPIWSANESCGWSWPLNRAMDKLGKAMKK